LGLSLSDDLAPVYFATYFVVINLHTYAINWFFTWRLKEAASTYKMMAAEIPFPAVH